MSNAHVSRRSALRAVAGFAFAIPITGLLAACGGQANSTAAAPTTAPAASNAAPTTAASAPQATAAPATGNTKAVVIWYGQDFIPGTTQQLQQQMTDFTKKTNVPVDFQVKSGAWTDQLNAAVQAGTAPDVWQSYDYECQYWNSQGQALDLTHLITKYDGQQGGFFPYVKATVMNKGKGFAVPLAVNTWPMITRQDILDKNNGGKFPDTWDDQIIVGKKILQPGKLYAYGWPMGKEGDMNNLFIGTLWTYGGKLQNEDGTFGLKPNDPAALGVLDLAARMYQEQIIPPAVVQWSLAGSPDNNKSYEDGQTAWTSNPLSIYTWCQANKPDLAKVTSFYNYPKGPAGSFGQVDVWGVTVWKQTKLADNARAAMDWWLNPTHFGARIRALAPRFMPIYQNMLSDKVWDKPLYKGLLDIAKTARIMAYASSPQAGYSTLTTRYLLGDMLQNLLVKKMAPKDAYQQFYAAAKNAYASV